MTSVNIWLKQGLMRFISPQNDPLRILLQHGQNIAGRIFEPRYLWTSIAMNAFLVGLNVGSVVMLKTYTAFGELVYRLVNIVYRKIKDSKRCRRMVGLGINNYSFLERHLHTALFGQSIEDALTFGDIFQMERHIHAFWLLVTARRSISTH